ncbi:alpha/beta hydrolase [Planomonospora corallina]|uniref:alpha/beta hydrolase n=1 Tax=Planomonospora corallina TaxID=1806052 RepID=UPI00366C98E1
MSALALATLVLAPSAAHASPDAPGASAAGAARAALPASPGGGSTPKADPTPSTPPPSPSPSPTESPDDLVMGTIVDTVAYGRHSRQRMDVWHQADDLRRPGVFLIHGGWWSSGDKKYMTEVSRSYAELGYTVFNINYRLSGDAAWPAQRIDVLDAIATARRHSALWSFDPNNYVVVGFSAGGHLATAVGTYKNGLPGLKGVVGISPVVSPLTAYIDGDKTLDANKRKLRAAAIRLAGGCEPAGRCARIWQSMEVPEHASRGDAPVLSVHSANEFVPPSHSVQLRDRLRQVGVKVTVLTEPGVNHSSPLYRMPGVAEKVQEWIAGRLL